MNDKFLDNLEEKYKLIEGTYVYIKNISRYYWVEMKKFLSVKDMCHNNMLTTKEIFALREFGLIQTYDNITYKIGGEKGKYNLLDENDILLPSNTPFLHNDIKELIYTVSGGKEENIDYLHKAIYYKYININDVNVPSIVFHGVGGSGKGTLMSLFETIFGTENVLKNLGQRELSGNFDTYKGQKIIVEYAEIATGSYLSDIKNINKLKNIIGSSVIQINDKGISGYQINNIAWFFISSNSNIPIKLDSKEAGNRRFNVIKSKIRLENGEAISKTIGEKKIVSDYLAWLQENYGYVKNLRKLENLENEDKKLLEDLSQDESNNFWDWLLVEKPELIGEKLKQEEVIDYLKVYCKIFSLNFYDVMKYFWQNSRYEKKKIRIGEKTYNGVKIL